MLRWVDAAAVEGKLKILMHQLLPQANLAAGCTSLFLARSAGDGGVRWLAKPKGAKALVISLLGAPTGSADDDDDCVVSVHARMRAIDLADATPPPGWPRAAGACVLLDATPGTLHVFDAAVHPLFVRLSAADVLGIWSFGAEGEHDATVLARQRAAALLPDP